jgi:hypothetical protein
MDLQVQNTTSARRVGDRARARAEPRRIAIAIAYAGLGAALLWSRLAYLGHSFWNDEILMIEGYVRAGPRHILAGPDLNHELVALLAWLMARLAGDSEIAFRLLSAVPFIAAVAVVAVWLHRRRGALSAILFVFLATVSPLLLDITRQARGYGLAFLAMSLVVVAALEALRTGNAWAVIAMCAAGVLGAWTLPQLAVAFVAVGAVLVSDSRTRSTAAVGLVASVVAIAAWYAPHMGAVHGAAQIPDGVQIGFPWVLTAPIDQILLPGLIWIDGTALTAGVIWLPLVALALVVAAASPFLRERRMALVLCVGPVLTVAVLWLEHAYVIPRYVSFLLAPWFILLATGAAEILRRLPARPALARTVICLVAIGILGIRFVSLAPDVVALPREAHRDVARVVQNGPPGTPVLAYMRNPTNLAFYLGRPVARLDAGTVASRVCNARRPVYYVRQPLGNADVTVPCLGRPGVRHDVFRQYARGGRMDVWLLPPIR